MSNLKGAGELRARIRAVQRVPKPIGRDWADATVELARAAVPVRTGNLRRSIRRLSSTDKGAVVVAHESQVFIDRGTKAHEVTPRNGTVLAWQATTGGTVFAKRSKIPRQAARPFRERVAREALRRKSMSGAVIKAWNGAG